jgi:beta-glucosidase
MLRFPDSFLWGVSSSAHQVEGGNLHNQWAAWEDGGYIRDGSRSHTACGFWENPDTDLELMQGLGINAARISVEWSRLEPKEGWWRKDVLARYSSLLREMLKRGIRPFVTLHHFTHPQWFEERGGFLAPDAIETFSRFVFRTVEGLRHFCSDWVTVNEPNVYCAFGYLLGEFPPGRKGDLGSALLALTRIAKCHAAAYRIIHSFQPDANVGWAQNYIAFEPGSSKSRDRLVTRIFDTVFNETFFDLLRTGQLRTPWNRLAENAGEAQGKYEFIGLNVYSRLYVKLDPAASNTMFARIYVPEHVPQGDAGADYPYGECYPGALTRGVGLAGIDHKPIYILENGVPDRNDRIRPWLLVNAAERMYDLLARGYDLRGYFHWSLTDNFEWAEGWRLRFGLYALDQTTQARTARPSAGVFRRIIAANGLTPELIAQYGTLNGSGGPDSVEQLTRPGSY